MKAINLSVPFFSQRENSYIWHYRRESEVVINKKKYAKGSPVKNAAGNEITKKVYDYCCNITCLAMVLNYLGVTKDTPYKMCQKIFADDFSDKNTLNEADFDRYVSYRRYTNKRGSTGYQCIKSPDILKKKGNKLKSRMTGWCYGGYLE